jgi:hypothetical protein
VNKGKHRGWCWIKTLEKRPTMYGPLIFDKGSSVETEDIFINGAKTTANEKKKEKNFDPHAN